MESTERFYVDPDGIWHRQFSSKPTGFFTDKNGEVHPIVPGSKNPYAGGGSPGGAGTKKSVAPKQEAPKTTAAKPEAKAPKRTAPTSVGKVSPKPEAPTPASRPSAPPSSAASVKKSSTGVDASAADKSIADAHPSSTDFSSIRKDMGIPEGGPLNDHEKVSIYDYTGPGFIGINGPLRAGTALDESSALSAKGLDSAMTHSTIAEPTMVFRGINGFKGAIDKIFGLEPGTFAKNPEVVKGKTLTDKGFLSTSSQKGVMSGVGGGVICHISVPSGAHGIDLMKAGLGRQTEHEILFARNSKLHVTKITNEGGKTILHMEMLK